jgi:hypothetical protein
VHYAQQDNPRADARLLLCGAVVLRESVANALRKYWRVNSFARFTAARRRGVPAAVAQTCLMADEHLAGAELVGVSVGASAPGSSNGGRWSARGHGHGASG